MLTLFKVFSFPFCGVYHPDSSIGVPDPSILRNMDERLLANKILVSCLNE